MTQVVRSTRLEIVRRALDEARQSIAGLPLTDDVKALHERLRAAEMEAGQQELGVTSARRRERLVRESLALTMDAIRVRRAHE